jgi:hypothetical protein
MKLCLKCGKRMDGVLVLAGMLRHPTCDPIEPLEIAAENLRQDLVDIIRWTDNRSARSMQKTIGPSELGDPCERKIAYRLAGIPEVNDWMDPLPAIVGTAIHTWMESAVSQFQKIHHMDRWATEVTVHPDRNVVGHADLYDSELQAVIDYKTVSPSKLKDWKAHGPSEQYKDQVNLYARGCINAGLPVQFVCLVAIPRSGWLSDIRVWLERAEPDRAQRALDRMYGLADKLIAQGDQLDFEAIGASPGRGCSYCPWYRGGVGQAGVDGCPGNATDAMSKFGEGMVEGV